jgi:hypothetical protein
MGCKNLECFEFSKSLFNSKNYNKIFNVCTLLSKIEKNDLEKSKCSKFVYPIRFQYEKFNESDINTCLDTLVIYQFSQKKKKNLANS